MMKLLMIWMRSRIEMQRRSPFSKMVARSLALAVSGVFRGLIPAAYVLRWSAFA